MSFPALNLGLLSCYVGKAADFQITLSSTGGALVVADIEAVVVTIKANATDADAAKILQKTLGAGITLTGLSGDNVLALLQLPAADTALLTAGRVYYFDVQVDTTARGPETAATGRLSARQPITVTS